MIDDFDFEDDLDSLKGDEKEPENSFFPPVNNTASKASLNANTNSRLSKNNDKNNDIGGLPNPMQNKPKLDSQLFPKATSKLGMANKNDDFDFGGDDDDFGLEQVKPNNEVK